MKALFVIIFIALRAIVESRHVELDCFNYSLNYVEITIDQINEDTLNVTWIEENPNEDEKFDDIVETIFKLTKDVCDIISSANSCALVNCKGNASEELTNLSNKFINELNCSIIFSEATEEIEDSGAQKKPISTKSTALINPDSTITPALPVTNLIVDAIYDDFYKVILLNVSWERNSDNLPEYYDFGIQHIENSSAFCDKHYHYETFHNSKFLTHIALPKQPASSADELQPGCTYKIWVKSQYFSGDLPHVIYTIPECVGSICNYCTLLHFLPNVTIHEVVATSFDTLKVTWSLPDELLLNHTYFIGDAKFWYRSNTTYDTQECEIVSNIPNTFHKTSTTTTINCHGLKPEEDYILIARFENSLNCTRTYIKKVQIPAQILLDKSQERQEEHWSVIYLQTSLFFVVVVLFSLLICFRQPIASKLKILTRTQQDRALQMQVFGTVTTGRSDECYNVIYYESEILDGLVDLFEFPRSKIKINKLLDSGAFGQVFSANILGPVNGVTYPTVAVKTLRDQAPSEEIEDFLSEIDILKKIGEHPHIVTLIGCCTLKQPYFMIMELIPCGSLKNYLLKLRNKWEQNRLYHDSVFTNSSDGVYISPDDPPKSPTSSICTNRLPSLTETEYTNVDSAESSPLMEKFNHVLEPTLDNIELQNFALQIAKGMAYLEEKQITHRDLATRNVLITEFRTLKISDFGLSRAGPYINNKTKKLPLRWMAIESIEEHFYNNKSDVWSFGVVLWEIGSLGALPYEKTPDCLILHDLLIGKRLERPGICTDELYTLMLDCWQRDTKSRPTFREIVELFERKERRIYVDFGQLNPTYVFPPSKLERR